MFLSQRRIVPRWKEWQPLPTHQLRLRGLVQIIGLNLGSQDLEGKICKRADDTHGSVAYYYTLHVTEMSAPFFTSDKIHGNNPKWKEVDHGAWENCDVFSGIQSFVLRLWTHQPKDNSDEILKVFGINLTGLVYLGAHLSTVTMPNSPNSLLFLLPGGYFCIPETSGEMVAKPQVVVIPAKSDHLRKSYNLAVFTRLNRVQKAICEKQAETDAIKQKIMRGDFMTSDRRASAALRKILNRNKPKSNQADIHKLKDDIELARFRVETLEYEKRRMLTRIAASREKLEKVGESNAIKESRTMDNYRMLQKSVQKYKEWLAVHVQRREAELHSKAIVNFRVKQLISEIHCIYPVEQVGDRYTICGVLLPDSEELAGLDDMQLSVALGFVAHAVIMVSVFLQVPLRYPVIHGGSRSLVVDQIAPKLPESERQFPLFCKGKEKLQFHYALYLINKNIAGLRWLCGLATSDLRRTLPNLAGLLNMSGVDNAPPASPSSSTREATPTTSMASPARAVPRYRVPGPGSAASTAPCMSSPRDRHSFSCSLDNGLNAIERRQASRGGSESRLCVAEDATKYLENWQEYKFSDYDSDQQHRGVFVENPVSSIDASQMEQVRRVSFGQEACDTSFLSHDTLLAERSIELGESFAEVEKSGDNGNSPVNREIDVFGVTLASHFLNPFDQDIETGVIADDATQPLESDDPQFRENLLLENVVVELRKDRYEIKATRGSQVNDKLPRTLAWSSQVNQVPTDSTDSTNTRRDDSSKPSSSQLPFSRNASEEEPGSSNVLDEEPAVLQRPRVDPKDTDVSVGRKVEKESRENAHVQKAVEIEDDVANRAEALASHATSFNMYRPRFGSRSAL